MLPLLKPAVMAHLLLCARFLLFASVHGLLDCCSSLLHSKLLHDLAVALNPLLPLKLILVEGRWSELLLLCLLALPASAAGGRASAHSSWGSHASRNYDQSQAVQAVCEGYCQVTTGVMPKSTTVMLCRSTGQQACCSSTQMLTFPS